jgi:hypothetical protein
VGKGDSDDDDENANEQDEEHADVADPADTATDADADESANDDSASDDAFATLGWGLGWGWGRLLEDREELLVCSGLVGAVAPAVPSRQPASWWVKVEVDRLQDIHSAGWAGWLGWAGQVKGGAGGWLVGVRVGGGTVNALAWSLASSFVSLFLWFI